MDNSVAITIDVPSAGTLRFVLATLSGEPLDEQEVTYQGPVDNLLLTTVDKLLERNRLHKFALKAVRPGQGIDKNSSLYRMIQSFATAITAAEKRP